MKKQWFHYVLVLAACCVLACCSDDDDLLPSNTKPEDLRLGYIDQVNGQRELPQGFRSAKCGYLNLVYDKDGVLRKLSNGYSRFYDVIYKGNVIVITDSASVNASAYLTNYHITKVTLNRGGLASKIETTSNYELTSESTVTLTYNNHGQLARTTEKSKYFEVASLPREMVILTDMDGVTEWFYDEQGTLTHMSCQRNKIADIHLRVPGNGKDIVGKQLQYNKVDMQYRNEFVYDTKYANPYLQHTNNSTGCMVSGGCDYEIYQVLAQLGLLGKGSTYLSSSVKRSTQSKLVTKDGEVQENSYENELKTVYFGSDYGLWTKGTDMWEWGVEPNY